MEPSTPPPEQESIFSEEEFSMKGYDKHIRNARIMLFIIAGLSLFVLFVAYPFDTLYKQILAGTSVVLSAIYFGLAMWTKKRPYTALMTALLFFVIGQVAGGIFQPSSIMQGWWLKIAILVMLILGVRNGKECQDMMDAFGKKG